MVLQRIDCGALKHWNGLSISKRWSQIGYRKLIFASEMASGFKGFGRHTPTQNRRRVPPNHDCFLQHNTMHSSPSTFVGVIFHFTNERSHWIKDNISNPILNNSILLKNANLNNSILLKNANLNNSILLKNANLNNSILLLKNANLNNSILLKNANLNNSILLKNANLNNSILLKNENLNNGILLKNANLNNSILLKNANLNNSILLKNANLTIACC